MFGLEDKQKQPFQYDIEKEIKNKPEKAKEILKKIEEHETEIKEILRKGENSKEFDELKKLLEGYESLKVVIGRIQKGK
jgi:transcription termination factor NusB